MSNRTALLQFLHRTISEDNWEEVIELLRDFEIEILDEVDAQLMKTAVAQITDTMYREGKHDGYVNAALLVNRRARGIQRDDHYGELNEDQL